MGIKVGNIENIPTHYRIYLFHVGGRFADSTAEWMEKNFDYIARMIGKNALITRGFEASIDYEILKAYKPELERLSENRRSALRAAATDYREDFEATCARIPIQRKKAEELGHSYTPPPLDACLIITDRSPNRTFNSLRHNTFLLIPLYPFNSEHKLHLLFNIIFTGVYIDEFQDLESYLNPIFRQTGSVGHTANDILELKPNVGGIGININNLIGRFLNRKKK